MTQTQVNFSKEIWEGWTVNHFIDELIDELDMIMLGQSFIEPFKSREELANYIKDNQPYYKKSIPEVNLYFARRYGL